MVGITVLWILLRAIVNLRQRNFLWRREAELILVYICLIVVARFTFFPFSKVNGQVQPLNLDLMQVWPFRINLLPLVYLFDYPTLKEILVNVIGNTTMFIPIGIIWPLVFRELNSHRKAIAAGVGFSLCIEILQLPFFERCSDIDDLILNSLGYLAGYGIYLLIKKSNSKK
jgi:glycopeptide antibiotics resistance protein